MNLQQAAQPRSSANGFGRRREKDMSSRVDNRFQPGKPNSSRVIGPGVISGSKGGPLESPSKDRLVYLTTCLIGHHVEVQVKNGSLYSGIFHAMNADRDFGVILKMARLTHDASFKGQKSTMDSFGRVPSKTLIIPSHELVQVLAKDLPITRDGLSNEVQGESQQDIMIDSYISQSRHVEVGRELEPWMPDENAPQCPELENVFDSPWTGRSSSWDQFKVNEALFGVKSTFNEELYTTKLERGPRTRELEEEAMRIAREIEGEETHDLHLAEERGVYPHASFDIDEETKYSSVYRGFDDSGGTDEDVMLNSHDMETFGDSVGPAFVRSFANFNSGKSGKGLEGSGVSSRSLSKDEIHSTQLNAREAVSVASDHGMNVVCGVEDDGRAQDNHIDNRGGDRLVNETMGTHLSSEDDLPARSDDFQTLVDTKKDGSEKIGVSSIPAASSVASAKVEEKTSCGYLSEDRSRTLRVTEPTNSRGRPASSTSSASEGGAVTLAPAAPALSPSSSLDSLSSEKSMLNPNAKEFKFNPNAKSFVPTQSPLRPVSPVNDSSFYFPANMPSVPHMHGMPVGMGVGPSFAGHQPALFNPQAAAMHSPQAYFPANAPQYGQQMILGHPRQVMYMPGYPAEMAYKGRDY